MFKPRRLDSFVPSESLVDIKNARDNNPKSVIYTSEQLDLIREANGEDEAEIARRRAELGPDKRGKYNWRD